MKIEIFRSFPTKGEKQITFLSQRNQLHKNRVKSAAYAAFLAQLFSFLTGFSNASSLLVWLPNKLVKS